MMTNIKYSYNNLQNKLQKNIFGQNNAIEAIVNYINISLAGLNDKQKPIGSFLFTGPTGVGKTELAKELAKNLNMNFERFDMSEYATERSADNLIGGAAGLVGYEKGGLLTNALIENPNSVVLFDEIEKADQKVLTKFLQIMDYGKLTSSKGEEANFRNAIIIFTSNLGAIKTTKRTAGFGSTTYEDIENDMDDFLSPEFKARINQIVEFEPLNTEVSQMIIKKYFNEINATLKQKNIIVEATERLIEKFLEISNSNLGARDLQNLITQNSKTIIANEIISGNLTENSKIILDWDNMNFTYSIEQIQGMDGLTQANKNSYFFDTAEEAHSFAKNNLHITITRSPCGKGYIAKELFYSQEDNICPFL